MIRIHPTSESCRMMKSSLRALVVPLLTLLLPATAGAGLRDVDVPIEVGAGLLQLRLEETVFTDPGTTARVYDDGSGCNEVVLSEPRVLTEPGRLRVAALASVTAGLPVGSGCVGGGSWQFRLEATQVPEVAPDGQRVLFRVVDSRVDEGTGVGGQAWELAKANVQPALDAFELDLRPALADVRGMLPLMLMATDEAPARAMLESLRLGSVEVTAEGLRTVLRMSIDREWAEQEPEPEPPLTDEELRAWTTLLNGWDAFVTYVVKQAAGTTASEALRRDLMAVLLEARYDIIAALSGDSGRSGADPVRELFLRTWKRLAPALQQLREEDLGGVTAVRYLSFVTAADALRALDAIGPGIGIEISADGLRRLARMLAPDATGDPLDYEPGVDPRLRELFDFGPPLPPPRPSPGVDLGAWLVAPARASPEDMDELTGRLNGWVPDLSELDEYLPMVRELLELTVDGVIHGKAAGKLPEALTDRYRDLVLATAWQETCWRQFVREGERIRPLRSSAGAVGLMQVTPSVWRGFYDADGLKGDIAYNAAAGAEILLHYLVDYALPQGEHKVTGDPDGAVRATYAAYNGGPAHLRRYRSADVSERLRLIDQAFWEKYRKVRAGDVMAVAGCYPG